LTTTGRGSAVLGSGSRVRGLGCGAMSGDCRADIMGDDGGCNEDMLDTMAIKIFAG
jgi:hypothetical protein